MRFVCPACKGSLASAERSFSCAGCQLEFPVVAGIPDFRLEPDPYISLEEDRRKGTLLLAASEGRTFEDLVRYYYSITPDHPPDLAALRVRHALAEVDLASFALQQARVLPTANEAGALLDVGCSTAALLVAASGGFRTLVGVDVAFRWLVVGQIRLRDAGVRAMLVCANAEALPFPEGAFDVVTATDVAEHVADLGAAVREARRVLVERGTTVWTTNNRYAPLPEPHIKLWGVGYLPRSWQRGYVARRRTDLRPYFVRLRSAAEVSRAFREAAFETRRIEAAALSAPHWSGGGTAGLLRLYNALRRAPGIASAARWFGPRLSVRATK